MRKSLYKRAENMSCRDENPNADLSDIVKILESREEAFPENGDVRCEYPILTFKNRHFHGICQFLFLGVLRRKLLFEKALENFSRSGKPKRKLMACSLLACAEIFEAQDENKRAKSAHSWVEYSKKHCSKSESGFLNAFLRKFPEICESIRKDLKSAFFAALEEKKGASEKFAELSSIYYSHPKFLVEKWIKNFGAEKTLEILRANSVPSGVYFRYSPTKEALKILKENSDLFSSTEFEDFWLLKSGNWKKAEKILTSKLAYIQDPSTSFAPKLLSPKSGESVLDLCSAPGGKSRMIADLILKDSHLKKPEGTLVACDFGEGRIRILNENLSGIDFLNVSVLNFDLRLGAKKFLEFLKEKKLPEQFDKVLLDAPCSNSGVLGRRPDARYRLSHLDFLNRPELQGKLLDTAAEFVKIGGTLVYSTCSIEPEENEIVARKFLEKNKCFELVEEKKIFPSENSDGAGMAAFLRKR